MKSFKIIGLLFITIFLISCSSSAHLSQTREMDYRQSTFEKTVFTPVDESTIKKSFSSDHQLMMSLLNRPMTADQSMMLAFARQSLNPSSTRVNFVSIRGDKKQQSQRYNQVNEYSALIAKDINAVSISGSL